MAAVTSPPIKTVAAQGAAALGVGMLSLLAACAPASPQPPDPPLPAQLEQLEDAVQELVREIHGRVADAPLDGARWAKLGMVYEANNLLPDGLVCYDRALELAPSDRLRYRRALTLATLGRVDEALAEARIIADGEGHTPPHVHWRMGSWELMRGNLDAAEASFKEATRVGRRYPGGFTGLARVHLQRDENEEALAALDKASLLVPLDGYVAQLLGAAYRQAGRLDEPEASLPSSNDLPHWADPWASELNAFRAVTRKMEAKALGKEGQTDASIAVLEELRASGEDELGALSIMAESYFRAGQLNEALAKFQECRAIAPRNVGTYLNIARVQEEMGERQAGWSRRSG